ncbi:MAG: hypothetical protein LBL07_03720 [Tannerella sp.]|jgi:hypothetical protein|nr:hypothetical protein [Tannerella sp.]
MNIVYIILCGELLLIMLGIGWIIRLLSKLKGINESLSKEGCSNKKSKTIFYWISGASFLFSVIAVCGAFVYKDTVIVDESIVLILVGMLATFVVVGNYVQVKDAKDEFVKTKERLEGQITAIKKKEEALVIQINRKSLWTSAQFTPLHASVFFKHGVYEGALGLYISTIEDYLRLKNECGEDNCESFIGRIVNNIFDVVKSMQKKGETIEISKETKEDWIKTLIATGDPHITEIIDFIKNIEIADENTQASETN